VAPDFAVVVGSLSARLVTPPALVVVNVAIVVGEGLSHTPDTQICKPLQQVSPQHVVPGAQQGFVVESQHTALGAQQPVGEEVQQTPLVWQQIVSPCGGLSGG
jgi:hypothetical protein